MKHIYLLSGLGVDQRAYQNIDLVGFEITFIKWITPIKNEALVNYAIRLAEQITSKYFTLVGVSFGGMVAIEIAKIMKPEKIIIISSAKTSTEIPLPFRVLGRLRLHYLIPAKFLKKPNWINYLLFGIKDDKSKMLLNEILRDTDPDFFRWAMNQIIVWKNKNVPDNVIHIHGTHDNMLPYRFVTCDISIPNAGHFMIVDKANKLTPIIRSLLT